MGVKCAICGLGAFKDAQVQLILSILSTAVLVALTALSFFIRFARPWFSELVTGFLEANRCFTVWDPFYVLQNTSLTMMATFHTVMSLWAQLIVLSLALIGHVEVMNVRSLSLRKDSSW
jgi:hypothetical protein